MSAEHTWHFARIASLQKMKADSDREVEGENGEMQAAESLKWSWASLKIRVTEECKCKRHLGQNFKYDFGAASPLVGYTLVGYSLKQKNLKSIYNILKVFRHVFISMF